MLTVAIAGASGGIGSAILANLASSDEVACIHATYHQSPAAGSLGNIASFGGAAKVVWTQLDATDEQQVADWLSSIGAADWLINCVGMLHDGEHGPEKSISAFSPEYFAKSMQINTLPSMLLAKYARTVLKDSQQGVFATISARVGSISDNRLGGWYSYRASKAALNMALKCLAIEWARNTRSVRVAAMHPGTTDSRLSRPFQKNVPQGKLFSPEKTAALLIEQIRQLHTRDTGCFIAYDGEEISW